MRFALLLTTSMLISGCTIIGGDDANCDDRTAIAAYNASENYELGEDSLIMRLEGTLEGEIGTFYIYLDAQAEAIRLVSPVDGDIRMKNGFTSVEGDDSGVYRDYDPASGYDSFLAFINEDEPSFEDDLTFSDYTVTCQDAPNPKFTFSYENDGLVSESTVEGTHPYRPLSGRIVDPALQDNFRASISYETPTITVDLSLPRIPTTIYIEATSAFTNARGGLTMDAVFTADTEWSKFSEMEFHLADSAGNVYGGDTLDDAAWDLGDGDYFQYDDRDNNNMVSAGDRIYMDLGPDLDIMFYDDWANEYAEILQG